MKKIMSAVVLVFVLLVITACGGNGELQENDRQPASTQNQQAQQDQNPDTAQNVIDEVGEALNQAQGNNNAIANISGEYYTFGDVINLWNEWELVFIDANIVRPAVTPAPTEEGLRPYVYETGIIAASATVTNISDTRLSHHMHYVVEGPSGKVFNTQYIDTAAGLMYDVATDRIPSIHFSVDPGETLEGYVFLVYDGEGDYWIRWPAHLVSIPVRLPVSR